LPAGRRPSTLRPDVTVHHLLSHTSHIGDYAEEEGPDPLEYETLWFDRPCYGPPGGEFHYSNAGYVLLGLIVEEVSGLSFVDAVRQQVFEPAGMAASGFFRLDQPVPDLAVGYLPSGRSNVYSIPVIGGADGGAQC